MIYTVENDVLHFPFWSGAKDRIDLFENIGAMDWLENQLEMLTSDGLVSDTTINDYVWFESENDLANELGIDTDDLYKLERHHLTIDDIDQLDDLDD